MDQTQTLFLDALRCAIRGRSVSWTEAPDQARLAALFRLAREQALESLIAQGLSGCQAVAGVRAVTVLNKEARRVVVRQASRTAEFLLLLRSLREHGLEPAILKGAVCRSLYPEPEQRPSSDEDLLIFPEEFQAYHKALLSLGLRLREPDHPTEGEDEVTYVDPDRDLYLELHLRPFSLEDSAFGGCCRFFEEALTRTFRLRIYGQEVRTLHPTDHLLYLLCHAYKHILYGGVGVRQICDLCLFAERYGETVDWEYVRAACRALGLTQLAAAFFRVGDRRLDIPCPEAFAEYEVDELPLLQDCLTGGLYGAEDTDRLHSSRITLDAVSAAKEGRAERGKLSSLFPSMKFMEGSFPYLRSKPWLLPMAWGQRIAGYVFDRSLSPARSLQIGRERVELLRKYKIIP